MRKNENTGRQIRYGIVLSYTTLIVGNVISLLYTPWMLHVLGQQEYGVYSLVSAFIAYLGLMDFGLGSTYMRFYVQYNTTESREKVASLTGMFLSIFGFISICCIATGFMLCRNPDFVFGNKLTEDELVTAQKLMYWLVLDVAFSLILNVFKTIINAHERFVFQKLLNLAQTILNPLLIIILLASGYRSLALVTGSLLLTIFTGAINIIYCFRVLNLSVSFKKWEFRLLREVIAFAVWIFVGEIIDQINWNVDKYLLGRFSGSVAVAVYGISAMFNTYFRQFSSYIYTMYVPEANRMVAQKATDEQLTDLIIKVGRLQFFILSLVASGFVFFGRAFCNLWAGREYDKSYQIALILMLPAIVPLIQNTAMTIIIAKNKHRFRSIVYLGIAIANVFLSIPLCKLYGGVGCALGTALAVMFGNGIIINIYYNRIGLQIGRFWNSIFHMSRGLVIPILCGVVMLCLHLSYNWGKLLTLIVLYTAIFALSMYLLGFNTDEKNLMRHLLIKIMWVFRMRVDNN